MTLATYLKSFSSTIMEQERKLYYAKREEARVADAMRRREEQALANITAAKDESGKPVYTNESSRKAAVATALDLDSEYTVLQSRLVDAEETTALLAIEIEHLKRVFSVDFEYSTGDDNGDE